MTNEELLALKELAKKAKPFTDGDERPKTWDEITDEDRERAGYNGEFFINAQSVIPELVDELLDHRQQQVLSIDIEVGGIYEVRPGQKWVIALPLDTSQREMEYLKYELGEWLKSDAPFAAVRLGNAKLVKLIETV